MQRVSVTLGNLVEGLDNRSAGRPFVLDERGLRAAYDGEPAHTSHVLYEATRDRVPSCDVAGETGRLTWRLDAVAYAGGLLPGTLEVSRSIGHWNPEDQWEVFEVVSGEVLLVLQDRGMSAPSVVACPTDAVVALPPGAWHLTYAAAGQAEVENIYCRYGVTESTTSAHNSTDKYFTRAPVQYGLLLDDGDRRAFEPDPHLPLLRRDVACEPGAIEPSSGGLLRQVMAGKHPDALSEPARFWAPFVPTALRATRGAR